MCKFVDLILKNNKMKKKILFILVFFAMKVSFAQNIEKTIPINDIRKAGVYNFNDTLVVGHNDGDVTVERTYIYKEKNYVKDSIEGYVFHFYKTYYIKLIKYGGSITVGGNYQKAS